MVLLSYNTSHHLVERRSNEIIMIVIIIIIMSFISVINKQAATSPHATTLPILSSLFFQFLSHYYALMITQK